MVCVKGCNRDAMEALMGAEHCPRCQEKVQEDW